MVDDGKPALHLLWFSPPEALRRWQWLNGWLDGSYVVVDELIGLHGGGVVGRQARASRQWFSISKTGLADDFFAIGH